MSGYAIELMKAVKNGHLQRVQELLDTGVDVESTDENGDSGLIVAVSGGHLELIDLLCRNEADVNLSKPGGDKPLMVAVAEGRRDVVDLLCQKFADVNATNEQGVSPLMSIRSDDHWDIAKLLIETYKADVNQKNARGVSVLMSAAEKGMKDVVRVLVENGADVDYATKSGWSALLKATQGGHLDTVNILLRKKANVNQNTKDNWTALNLACFKSYSSIAETLIRHHADVNNVTSKGFSPLMCACNNRDLRIVKLLMDHGADKNKITTDGMTALELAHLAEDEEVEYLLTFDGDNNELLMQTSRDQGKANIFKMLLEFGIDVNITSKNKTSVLMTACKAGNLKAVQLLLSRDDVMIDAVNSHGWNALMMASHGGYLEIVSELLKKGAEVNKSNESNDSALLMATYKGHAEIVELLLQFEADVNHANQHGWTAAMLASQNNHVRMLQFLLQQGAAVDMVNNEGYSPLMIASEYGLINIAECLCGINGGEHISVDSSVFNSKNVHVTPNSKNYINISNDNGESALMLACRQGHEEIVELLLNRGAKLNHRGNDGLDPLLTAATSGHLAVAKILLQHQADVNSEDDSEDDSGDTALTIATKRNDLNLARLLLEHNANMNHQNKISLTPLVLAWERDHEELLGVLKLYKTKQRKENNPSVDDFTDPGNGGSFHSRSTDDVNSDLEKKQLKTVENISHKSELPGSYSKLTDEVTNTIEQRLCPDAEPIFRNSKARKSPRSLSIVSGSPQFAEPVSSTLHYKDNQSGDVNLFKLMGGHELLEANVHSPGLGDTLGALSATGTGFTNARHQINFTHRSGHLALERNQQFKAKSHSDAETQNSSNHSVGDKNVENMQDDNLGIFTEMGVKDTFSIEQEVNDNISTKQNQTDNLFVKQEVKHFVSIKSCEKDAFSIKLDGKDIVSTKQDVSDTASSNMNTNETVFLNRDTNETVSLNRNTNETVSLNRDTNETVSLNRNTNETVSLNRNTNETVSLNRNTNETVSLNRDTNETVSLNPDTNETVSLNRVTNETVSLNRDANETVSLNQDTNETVSLNQDTNETVSLNQDTNETVSLKLNYKDITSINQDHKSGVSIKQESIFPSESNGSIDPTSKNSSIGLVIEPTIAEENSSVGLVIEPTSAEENSSIGLVIESKSAKEKSSVGLVIEPTSAEENSSVGLVIEPTIAEENSSVGLVIEPTSAEENSSIGLVIEPTSAEENSSIGLLIEPKSAEENSSVGLVIEPKSAEENSSIGLVIEPKSAEENSSIGLVIEPTIAEENSSVGLVIEPTSAEENSSIGLVIEPTIAEENSSVGLVIEPTSAEENSSIGLVIEPTSAEENSSIGLVIEPKSAEENSSIGLVIEPKSADKNSSIGLVIEPTSAEENSSIGLVIEPTRAEGNTCVSTNLHFEEIRNKDSAQLQTVKPKPQIIIKKDGFLFQTSLNAQESMSDHQHMQASVSRFRSFPMTHQKDEQHVKNPVFSVHASRENSRIIPKDRFDEPKLKGNDKEENNTQLSRNTARNGQKEDLENIVAKTSIKNNEVLTSSSLESAAVDPREDTSLKLCVEESPDPTRSENVLETHIDDNSEIRLMSDFVTMSEHHSELELLNSSVLLGSSNHQIAETKALSTRGKSHCSYVPPSPIDTREDFVSVHKKETGNPTGKRTQPLSSIKSNIRIGSVDYLTMGESPVECLQHSKLAHIQGRRNDVTRVDPLSLSAYLMDNRVFLPENTIRGDSGNDQSSPTPMDTSALSTTETPITSPKQDEPIPKWLADIISAVGSSSPVNASKPDTPLHLNIHYDATVHNVTIPSTQYCAINNSSITASNEPPVAAASKIGSETKRDVTSVRGRKEPLPPEEAALILKHYHYLKNELDATAVVEHLCAEGIFDSDDKRDVLAPSSSKRKSHVLLQKLLNAGTGDAFDVFVEIVEEVQPCVSDKLNVASGVAGRTRSKKNCCVQ